MESQGVNGGKLGFDSSRIGIGRKSECGKHVVRFGLSQNVSGVWIEVLLDCG